MEAEEIISLVIKWAVPFLCGICIGCVGALWKKTKAIGNGMQSLLRAEIIRNHKEYTNKGYCPIYAREALEKTYKAYHALGGNDVATQLYQQTLDLPTGDLK